MKINREESGSLVTVSVDGLPKGMGETYGNFIRRSILLGDSGWDLASVRINKGEVKSKFDIVEGVLEDCLELCFNLKEIKYESKDRSVEPVRVEYVGTGSDNQVTAGDLFKGQDNITVMDPDLVICNLTGNSSISLELVLTYGEGFVSELSNGRLIRGVVDASFIKEYIVFSTEHSEVAKNCHYTVNETEGGGQLLTIVLDTKTSNYKYKAHIIAKKSLSYLKEIYVSL